MSYSMSTSFLLYASCLQLLSEISVFFLSFLPPLLYPFLPLHCTLLLTLSACPEKQALLPPSLTEAQKCQSWSSLRFSVCNAPHWQSRQVWYEAVIISHYHCYWAEWIEFQPQFPLDKLRFIDFRGGWWCCREKLCYVLSFSYSCSPPFSLPIFS